VQTGDRVLFSPDDHHAFEIAGEEYLLLRERDLHAVASERNDENTGLYL
jgi:chaperonin GroES